MKIKNKKRLDYSFSETGAMSDLAFLLLLFFLAVGTFVQGWGYKIDSGRESTTASPESLELELTEAGFRMEGRKISTFMAGHRVSAAVMKNPDAKIIISVDPEVEYQMVIDAIDIVKKAGAENLRLHSRTYRQAP